ncbi:MAG: hypothetical protein EOP09_10920, partial [Proteobacteria bacterium]
MKKLSELMDELGFEPEGSPAVKEAFLKYLMKRLMDRALALTILGTFFASTMAVAGVTRTESVPGEFIVKLRTPVSQNKAQINVLSHQLGAYIKSTIPGQNIVVIKRPVFETQK